jgi:DNA-binding IclR family transcriptional regulator
MPGMRLTIDQAMRLWDLDRQTCQSLLNSLVEAHFLEIDAQARYRKAHPGY